MASVLDIQQALQWRGHDPGPLDGRMGRMTLLAIRALQRAHRIPPDGMVGAATFTALFGAAVPAGGSVHPPWHQVAEGLLGTREIAGPRHSEVIMGFARRLGLAYRGDETPWCGLFVAHCLATALPDEPLPANPLGARNWLTFGVPVTNPAPGTVLVFSRGDPSGWQGHVGFYAGEDGDSYAVLGGNQSNSVTIARIAKNRRLGMRWPRTVPISAGGAVRLRIDTQLSLNEA